MYYPDGIMPNVAIYLPDDLYKQFNEEEDRSKLIQKLLREHYEKKVK